MKQRTVQLIIYAYLMCFPTLPSAADDSARLKQLLSDVTTLPPENIKVLEGPLPHSGIVKVRLPSLAGDEYCYIFVDRKLLEAENDNATNLNLTDVVIGFDCEIRSRR